MRRFGAGSLRATAGFYPKRLLTPVVFAFLIFPKYGRTEPQNADLSEVYEAELAPPTPPSPGVCANPWIFFDLGAYTLLETPENQGTHDLENIRFMPGAREYLKDLSEKGYPLGLLINWPPAMGGLDELKQYLVDRWVDANPFDWELFKAGVFLSTTDRERKPLPPLFEKAADRAKSAGCKTVYQSSLPKEIDAANLAGMAGYHVGEPGRPFYLPEGDIRKYIERRQ